MTPPTTDTEPATRAGRRLLEWIAFVEKVDDPAGNTIYDEIRRNFLPAIEREAAERASGGLDGEAFAAVQGHADTIWRIATRRDDERSAPEDERAALAWASKELNIALARLVTPQPGEPSRNYDTEVIEAALDDRDRP